jgi:hypothetical protein
MSNIEEAIQDLISQEVQESIDSAIDDNYTITDLRDRLDNLESMADFPSEDDIMMRLARLIIKDDPANRTIVFQTHIDKLNKEIEDLKAKLEDKEEVNG